MSPSFFSSSTILHNNKESIRLKALALSEILLCLSISIKILKILCASFSGFKFFFLSGLSSMLYRLKVISSSKIRSSFVKFYWILNSTRLKSASISKKRSKQGMILSNCIGMRITIKSFLKYGKKLLIYTFIITVSLKKISMLTALQTTQEKELKTTERSTKYF